MHNLYIIKDQDTPPPSYSLLCSHHTLTEGMCTVEKGGCDNCPGKELLAEKQKERAAEGMQLLSERNRWQTVLFASLFAALGVIGFLAMANSGLSRAEYSYQISRV